MTAGRSGWWRRALTLALGLQILAVVIGAVPAASADAPGPTDYRTDIIGIEPAHPALAADIIGGDAFIRLRVTEPVEVVVLGYRSEDYLRFDADGTVVENRRSPATWLNQDRFGGADDVPSFADHQAPPEWVVVADNGEYAWHDHRTHWMQPTAPIGAQPGDQVLDSRVQLLVDGEPVEIVVASFLLEPPSVVLPALGAIVGAALAAGAWRGGRTSLLGAALIVGVAAFALGLTAFASVPAITEPQRLLWLLPVIGVVSAIVAFSIRPRLATTVYADGLITVAGASVAGWAVLRLDALQRAFIPSNAPSGVDRFVIIVALIVGIALVVKGVIGLVKPERLQAV